MLIQDVLGGSTLRELEIIKQQCSQYLKESAGLPLFKLLPTTYATFQKVKVRRQKHQDPITEVFDKAFGKEFYNLRQRAIFANGDIPAIKEGFEPYYVFPIDGYKFLYSKTISNSSHDYQHVIETMLETFDNQSEATDLVTDLLKMSYLSERLNEGIASRSEIIFYGIPFYYAVHPAAVPDYSQLFA